MLKAQIVCLLKCNLSLICSQEIPQQMNGSDCGMFTCKYADYITKDKPITFTQVIQTTMIQIICLEYWRTSWLIQRLCSYSQTHMPYFRKRMVWEILNHKLLWYQDDICELVSHTNWDIQLQVPWRLLLWESLVHQLIRSGTNPVTVRQVLSWSWLMGWTLALPPSWVLNVALQ